MKRVVELNKHSDAFVPERCRSVFDSRATPQSYGALPFQLECVVADEAKLNTAPFALSSTFGAHPGDMAAPALQAAPLKTALRTVLAPLALGAAPSIDAASAYLKEALGVGGPAQAPSTAPVQHIIAAQAEAYGTRHSAMLAAEELQMIADMKKYDLHTVPLRYTSTFPNPLLEELNREAAHRENKMSKWSSRAVQQIQPVVRELRVPGALESQPALTLGDIVFLRRAEPRGVGVMGSNPMQQLVANEIIGIVIHRKGDIVRVQLPSYVSGAPVVVAGETRGKLGLLRTPKGRKKRKARLAFLAREVKQACLDFASFYDVVLSAEDLRAMPFGADPDGVLLALLQHSDGRLRLPAVSPPAVWGVGGKWGYRQRPVHISKLLQGKYRPLDAGDTLPGTAAATLERAYYHVRFAYSYESSALYMMRRALRRCCGAAQPVTADPTRTMSLLPQFRALLFPTREAVARSLGTRSAAIAAEWSAANREQWFQPEINAEQKHAVVQLLAGCTDFPLLLFGPAGTGKTMTIVEGILQLLRRSHIARAEWIAGASEADDAAYSPAPAAAAAAAAASAEAEAAGSSVAANVKGAIFETRVHDLERALAKKARKRTAPPRPMILVVAPSNAAADVIAMRLVRVNSQPKVRNHFLEGIEPSKMWMVRVNSHRRFAAEVRPAVLKYCLIGKSGAFRPPTEEELADEKGWSVIVTTCANAGKLRVSTRKFSHIIIDEAAQALEAECLVPMALASCDTTVVLAGDPRQLGPTVRCAEAKAAGLGLSMMERLLALPAYKEAGAFDEAHPVVVLRRNYRAHEALLALPSRLFYNDALIAAAPRSVTHSMVGWAPLLPPRFCHDDAWGVPCVELPSEAPAPMLLWGVEGVLRRDIDSPSYFNVDEVATIVTLITTLVESPFVECGTRDIGVIAPFRRQVAEIRTMLRRVALGAVRVGTHDDYQGQETRVLLISTTLSNAPGSALPIASTQTLLGNSKAFNVAITRAQALCIVVGNPTVLADDPDWREMVRFCAERDAIRGCGFHSADLGIDCAATLPPSEYAAAVHRTLELAGVGKLSKRMWPMFETKEADKQLGTDSVTDVDGVIDEDDDDTLTALHPRSLAALLASFGSSTTDDDEQSFHHELYGGEIDDCELQEFYSSELRWSVKL